MDLYFLRHGLAGHASQWKGDDWDRPLTEEGQARLRQEAATMARLELVPEVVLSSPLLRALETAQIVAPYLTNAPRVSVDKRLAPGFGPKQLAQILEAYAGSQSLMLVGHEPDFSQTIGHLIGGGQVVCKKGGLAWVEVPDLRALKGELIALIPPAMLAGRLSSANEPID
jgi:phosphohistidine phosphatase